MYSLGTDCEFGVNKMGTVLSKIIGGLFSRRCVSSTASNSGRS